MSSELLSNKTVKKYFGFSQEKVSVEQTKRQRILSHHLLSWFAPKHYPRMFLDQRLGSRLFS